LQAKPTIAIMKNLILICTLCVFVLPLFSETSEKQLFRVMCYNVENYFDCVDDSLTNDEEYLPGNMRGWNYHRYVQKQANIARVIVAVGGWTPPALVGLCEVESRKALIDLTRYATLRSLKYDFVHYESPDARGVDVALLYQAEMFRLINSMPVRIKFPESPGSKTRDILFVQGQVPSGDTLSVYVCHFPSRLGGELESAHKRNFVAARLKQHVDSMMKIDCHANILIMGDFNDYPDNESMEKVLQASYPLTPFQPLSLYNLMFPLHKEGIGTHKHSGDWGALDQIIVSANLLKNKTGLFTLSGGAHIFDADFLSEDDVKFLGKQPYRTYVGMRYNGGFSDHYPVYLDLWYQSLYP
jgi:endonuclease/exonuclease/phosphatase family metal-dependent hydrolase